MTDRRAHDMEVEDLERLLRGLPHREPSEGLRQRVLAAGAPARPPFRHARPAHAVVALIALIAIDLLVITIQDRQLARALPARPAAMMAAVPAPDTGLSWLREIGLREDSIAVVSLTRPIATPDAYFSLRDSLLANGSGG